MDHSALGRLDTLPALPYVAHEILIATSDSDPSLAAVAGAVAKEPGLTARIVAMANSAFFGSQSPVYSAEDAVARLGLKRVRVMSASILLAQQFDASRCRPFRAEDYWHEAMGTAFTAARLSPYAALEQGTDACYLGGLLHNIGLLLLVHVFPAELSDILYRYQAEPESSLAALLNERLGCDHHAAGQLLLAEWGLPQQIVAAAAHAHEPWFRGPHERLVHLVRIAREWVQHDYGALPETGPLQELSAERLTSVAALCRGEQDQLAAFARLLAAG